MRLTADQQQAIHRIVEEQLGTQAEVRLFGSRLNDHAKGGDIDLLVELNQPLDNPAEVAAGLSARIMRAMRGRKVDVLIAATNLPELPIHRIARAQGALL